MKTVNYLFSLFISFDGIENFLERASENEKGGKRRKKKGKEKRLRKSGTGEKERESEKAEC